MHFIFICIHLICAVFFIAYVFFDVCVYHFAYKYQSKEDCDKIKKAYTKSSIIIFASIFILLLLSGFYLLSFYEINSFWDFFASNFGIFLFIKLLLLITMLVLTFYSLFFIKVLKRKDPLKSHLIALILCILIVICAKAMLYF
ncbi:trehalose-6-phosphate synthase [Campylobacter sp. IFREMER_LSEM_CL2151]|uniref:trehalose-6-phosphate synthase n=1 Tax=Campylobacter sp. IFREMER_LSEM_CL2151 TaxID=2911620 RepID=UPI0021E8EF4B|nr:trehalose-6-phosphate synthase [Campylobacter sp. IFREMER_LSEM_CL2151]MCV3374811.1 trehalose-6-phosphate synthase [Campylobacter sp. IFREMER_LSEM_CL2151]